MNQPASALGAFVLRVFLWLPLGFAIWHVATPVHTEIATGFARLFVSFFNALLVSATESGGVQVVFVTTLKLQQAGQIGVLTIEVNPLIYTYGLALFLALMLAARAQLWRILAGAAILVPFQGWGIAFDFLAHVGTKMGPEVAVQAGLLQAREAIALAYQLGNLIFPSLVPVMMWIALETRFIEGIRARNTSPMSAPT